MVKLKSLPQGFPSEGSVNLAIPQPLAVALRLPDAFTATVAAWLGVYPEK
jgi:hypothetical protein